EKRRRQSFSLELVQDAVCEVIAAEVCERTVDRDPPERDAFLGQILDIGKDMVDHPIGEGGRKKRILKSGTNGVGGLESPPVMMPAQECLEADNLACLEVHLGLVEGNDPVIAERTARLAQHRLAAFGSLAHVGLESANAPCPVR